MGLAFLLKTTCLLPLTLVALTTAVGALGYRASQRHGRGPVVVGALSAVLLIVGRFAVSFDLLMYVGVGLLISASVWNSWPKKQPTPALIEPQFPCDTLSESKEN